MARFRLFLFAILLAWLISPTAAALADALDFTLFRLGAGSPAVLVVGGIQGDEPGGFSAATLLATRYEIQKGAIWVVPNLNFPSIIKRSRGIYGDMNRKFARLDESDPEFGKVRKIQDLICDPGVQLVLNLHDGSGFYRPKRGDSLHGPSRWGQSIIIDQEDLDAPLGELAQEAEGVAKHVNSKLLDKRDAIHVRNTHTAAGDKEMERSLSWYAVRNGKAAFGLEASKEFSVAARIYYHLSMIEEFLRIAGVEFERDFELSIPGIEQAMYENLGVAFAGNRLFLPLEDVRPQINYFPLPPESVQNAITSKPIMAVVPCESHPENLCVHYGNRIITVLRPDWHELTGEETAMQIEVDGKLRSVAFGQIVEVRDSATVFKKDGYRVNAIGFDEGLPDEAGVPLYKKSFRSSFSLDKGGTLFRVEVYRGARFAGMFLLRFAGA